MDIRQRLHLSGMDSHAPELARKWGLGLEVTDFCYAPMLDDPATLPAVREKMAGIDHFWLHAPFAELAPCAVDPLVREGTAHLPNVTVCSGGDFIVSRSTFPAYFLRDEQSEDARCDLDLTLFARHIAPALHIARRFVGEEPFSPTTAAYNRRMKEILPTYGVSVTEIPRLENISATAVRRLLAEERLADIQPLVPETTYAYCQRHFGGRPPRP